MKHPLLKRLAMFAVASGAVGLTACGNENPASTTEKSPTAAIASLGELTTATPEFGKIKLCKSAASNEGGTFAVSRASVGTSSGTVQASVTLAAGECRVVAEDISLAQNGSDVTFGETPAPDLVSITGQRIDTPNSITNACVGVGGAPCTNPGTTFLNSFHGSTFTYTNTAPPPPPPPPPAGNLGCSPGYWKNHNFPAGYAKTALFNSDIPGTDFANAFPSTSFQTVLSTGGGGLISLGRHTVSAYFNAVSLGAGYPLSPADVVTMFNAAFASGDYGPTSDLFASYEDVNGRICPNPTGK